MLQIRIYGIVQGVGFRPTVSRHAVANHIFGTVCNKGPYVEVLAQGTGENLNNFIHDIREHSPKRAIILKMDCKERKDSKTFTGFSIIESKKTTGSVFVSPDIAVCDECKQELFDPSNRRYLHPFINCTCCGPRLTILESMPYDRERTSMHEFPMCESCATEYTSPDNRRFDAQPVCCNNCGPEVYLIHEKERGKQAITTARRVIAQGGIVAIKGIGGFHLCCDATNNQAVNLLRTRKNRPVKPFAVMMKNYPAVLQECLVEPGEKEILTGHQKPILLLNRKKIGKISEQVAPGNPKVGVMLPYAPIHLLLFTYPDEVTMPECLVMTSGNVSGAPICRTDEDAIKELDNLCDAMLSHNRKIRLRADDSVMDYYRGKPYMIRRSRGYAPLPVMLKENWKGTVLATGGELKNSFCIAKDDLFYLSPYIGDMEDVRTVGAFRESVGRMEDLLDASPSLVACDMHPKYQTSVEAENLDLPLTKIQHHYAHIVSCMAENDCAGPVIGVALDGTGFGSDATIWGGEIMRADYNDFTRLASIEPFLQVGADASSREGWRIATALIHKLYPEDTAYEIIEKLGICSPQNAKVQFVMADKKINAITSTSAGRLFDGVSAILGICNHSSFEGEAAIKLQFAAKEYTVSEKWDMPIIETDNRYLLPTNALVKKIIEGKLGARPVSELAYDFHAGLAESISACCSLLCKKEKINTVALSGGVFQNTLLLNLCQDKLEEKGLQVLLHSLVPPNDGGIALGQAVVAMNRMNNRKNRG